MEIEILGSGTSMGVPIVGCNCRVCKSPDSRNRRLRTSAFIRVNNRAILIDTSLDYRQQMLRSGIQWIDAVLYTHHHVDHILGLDDLRSLNLRHNRAIPVFSSQETLENIQRVFAYVFESGDVVSDIPRIEPHIISGEPFEVLDVPVTPIPLYHGDLPVFGYRIGDFAYCTDVNHIPESSYELLSGLQVLILDALRFKPHPTHFSIDEAVEAAQKIGAGQTFFTHLTHDVPHEETERRLPEGIRLAYDGLKIKID